MLNNDLLLSCRPKFSISTNVSSGGSVSVSPQGKQYAGTLITVTCSPSSAYQFSSISIVKQDGTTVGYTTVTSGSRYTFIMPSSNVTVNVNYSFIPTYSISLNASGGSVQANKTSGIRAGEIITLTMTPNAYYFYSSLTVRTTGGSNVSLNSNNGSTATFVMPSSNVNVDVWFAASYNYWLTTGRIGGGYGYQYGVNRENDTDTSFSIGSMEPVTNISNGDNIVIIRLDTNNAVIDSYMDTELEVWLKDSVFGNPSSVNLYLGRADTKLKVTIPMVNMNKWHNSGYRLFNSQWGQGAHVNFFPEQVGVRIPIWLSNTPPPW